MLKVYDYFSNLSIDETGKKNRTITTAQWRREWSELSKESQAQLIAGVADGTLTY